MSCPTCHSPAWKDAPGSGSLPWRLFASLFRLRKNTGLRVCKFCGTTYRDPDLDDEEDARIAERISRIEEQLSTSFDESPSRPSLDPDAGIEVKLADASLCLACGYLYETKSNDACPRCGEARVASSSPGQATT